MAKKTPSLWSSGKWVLRSPWNADPNTTYTCHAIRTFEDIEKLGESVYDTYYKPYIQNGQNGWLYENEKLEYPSIVTLISNDNRIIFVPDTFITSFPSLSEFKYSQVVLSVPLGILPDSYKTTHIENAVKDKVATMLGITINPFIAKASLSINPTLEEHLALEANRNAAITNVVSYETQLIQERQKNSALQDRLSLYEDILRENGLLI